jgi:two-component system chemotaxis response regulator CheB
MHDIVVVGGSAGALEGLIALLQDVPESLDASVYVVLHSTESGLALVPGLLQRRSRLAIRVTADGDPVSASTKTRPRTPGPRARAKTQGAAARPGI